MTGLELASVEAQPLVKDGGLAPQSAPPPPPPPQPAAGITGNSLFFFAILLGQSVCGQTFYKLSQNDGSYQYNTMSAAAVSEGMKLGISMTQLMADKRGNIQEAKDAFKGVPKRVYMAYAFLAFSYAAYNQVIFYVMKLVDPGTFSLFKSLTPAAVAFLNFVSFGHLLTQAQVLCIIIQMFGIVPVVASTGASGKVEFTYGVKSLIVMTATILFGSFNTVYNASVVKKESANYPLNLQNSILYILGTIINICMYHFSNMKSDAKFFDGYGNVSVLVLIFLNSTIGITISILYKYGDALLKTLSQPMASSVLVFISYFLFDAPLDIGKLSGAGTVIASTMLYLKLPAASPAPPATDVKGNTDNVMLKQK